jgi:GNAT superfamily N-acetyltransferase
MTHGPALNLDGYTDLPRGKIATIVTYLEMTSQAPPRPDPPGCEGVELVSIKAAVARYLAIYRELGERWMWFSRLVMPEHRLAAILGAAGTEVYALTRKGADCGLLELDFSQTGACEIAFFGLFEAERGTGSGRWMMNRALARAWRPGVTRVWVHTCTFDDPRAPEFYGRSGFRVYKQAVEVCDDPRLHGKMRRDAAPHVPLLG